jgi:hypothetical protein
LLSDDYRGRKGLPKKNYTVYKDGHYNVVKHLCSIDVSQFDARVLKRNPWQQKNISLDDEYINFNMDDYNSMSPV